jgi:Cu-Zn family superoxide dismutase
VHPCPQVNLIDNFFDKIMIKSGVILLIIIYFIIIMTPKVPIKAVCLLQGKVKGVIYLEEVVGGTKIYGEVSGLGKNQEHAMHIHQYGDLTNGCTSTCAHYNPFGKNHGCREDKERHVGDLGNISANNKGVAKFDFVDKLVKLKGKYSVIGRSFVIHKDKDDCGKGGFPDSLTTGHAGARIGCGVIGYAKSC